MLRAPLRSPVVSLLALCATSLLVSEAAADPLTAAERTARCAAIRDVAAANGISSGFLLAGIAQAETSLSHCWEELVWACQGPVSPDCGGDEGGPVVAGAADGPCDAMQGGLGMFQFDGGTFDDTLERDGDGVLLLSGNITRAVDFVVNMVMGSAHIDVTTAEEAKAWMNQVTVGGPLWDAWITTVTHYYNGCVPGSCGVFDERYQHYSDAGTSVYNEQGADFWVVELPPCAPIPPDGATLEETDPCFTKGGPLPYWRVGIGGESNLHVWTGTTDDTEAVNFADWTLTFDEAGLYRVEVTAPNGTTPLAAYVIDHAGTSSEVAIDQSTATGFVSLGDFQFDTSADQGVYIADNTGDASTLRLSVDALKLTRLDGGSGGTGGAGAGEPVGATGGTSSGGSSGEGGHVGAVPGDDDGGCDCALARGNSREGSALRALGLLLAAGALRARRRRS